MAGSEIFCISSQAFWQFVQMYSYVGMGSTRVMDRGAICQAEARVRPRWEGSARETEPTETTTGSGCRARRPFPLMPPDQPRKHRGLQS